MTNEGFKRACSALMHARTAAGDKIYFPKVYVSQDSPSFTELAARRYNEMMMFIYKKPFTPIEVVTFEQAWKATHDGNEPDALELNKVCIDIDKFYAYEPKSDKRSAELFRKGTRKKEAEKPKKRKYVKQNLRA